ncbi:hypothetical protein CLV35_2738 [Motilibacter peucedani]|uniref:Uncharacterized protein n=1 Tax=Motilibacter peucedani TaxID=598650 RepID=A0A420XMJ2_9ACTN|nr:hypothetical protein [Motilibacter peucedani]RKS72494.1 hypothetical protein CLV35_2738 [Motilibacter peucedani]
MTTTPFEPLDSPEPRTRVEDLEQPADPTVSEDPDIETPSVPPEEDVTGDAALPEPPD